jgi:hypothetical protein
LPARLRDTSIVVIDGPFGCVDPLDDTLKHVLGHVVHTIHAENIGHRAIVPARLVPFINQGLITNPPCSRFSEVVQDLGRYVPGLREAVHVGSSFVVRAVLAHEEATDRRPTIVTRHDEQVMSIFSGKLGTAVSAGKEALALIEAREAVAA